MPTLVLILQLIIVLEASSWMNLQHPVAELI